jgi:phenylalanyl-tRNA synthetase beta chain
MNVTISWLREYVPVDLGPRELAELLTMRGLEVEDLRPFYDYLGRVVVSRITQVAPLEGSDSLRLCRVEADRERQVVCGAPNVAAGQLVPLALEGARLPGGKHVESARIGGELSEGMLCSEAELALGDDASGVMVLSGGLKVGERLDVALGLEDWLLEVAVTPNRPDCLSVIGLAREVGAGTGQKVRYPNVRLRERKPSSAELLNVHVERTDLCPRYTARVIRDVKAGPSPAWMQARLRAAGVRPINNLVDITNYVLMEYGQPLHAFDYSLLAGNRLIIRAAKAGERLTTLDGVAREFADGETLLICDAARPVALAGIMGGAGSEVTASTQEVVIESALFDPVTIRRTAKRLGISTESSHRFERGVDPVGVRTALDRAAQLMAELAGGEVAEGAIDHYPRPIERAPVELKLGRVNTLLGVKLTGTQAAEYLRALEMEVQPAHKETFFVRPPSFRVDIEREADLVEELARSLGYDNIPATAPRMAVTATRPRPERLLRERVGGLLVAQGMSEIVTYSFTSAAATDRLRLAENDPRRGHVPLLNPLSEEQAVMRTTLAPGLLETARRNIFQGSPDLCLFDVGRVFLARPGEDLPVEVSAAGGLFTGLRTPHNWYAASPEPVDFYDAKGALEALFEGLRVEGIDYSPDAGEPFLVPEASCSLMAGAVRLGWCGRVEDDVLAAFGFKEAAYIFEIDLDRLLPMVPEGRRFRPLPKYPAALRDLALVMPEATPYRAVLETISTLGLGEVEAVRLFDVYRGKPIEAGKKSVALSISFRSGEKTLEEAEVNRLLAAIVAACENRLGAVLRSS